MKAAGSAAHPPRGAAADPLARALLNLAAGAGDWAGRTGSGDVAGVGEKNRYDPICGKPIAWDADELPTAEYKKRKYFFCSETCQKAFQKQTIRFRMSELARAGALLSPGRVRWGLS